MTHGSEWDMEIWRPSVENVTLGRSHERLCVICFVVWTSWRRRRIICKMAAMQNKQNVNKNNVEYVLGLQCRIYLVNVTWPSDSSMSDVRYWTIWRSTVTRSTFDNAQRHVTAFRPISEAARSGSCDNEMFLPTSCCVAVQQSRMRVTARETRLL